MSENWKPVLTLQSINIEWAKSVSLKDFKLNLAYYNNQNLEELYNSIHGIDNKKDIGSGSTAPNITSNKKNGNSKQLTKKPKGN